MQITVQYIIVGIPFTNDESYIKHTANNKQQVNKQWASNKQTTTKQMMHKQTRQQQTDKNTRSFCL